MFLGIALKVLGCGVFLTNNLVKIEVDLKNNSSEREIVWHALYVLTCTLVRLCSPYTVENSFYIVAILVHCVTSFLPSWVLVSKFSLVTGRERHLKIF